MRAINQGGISYYISKPWNDDELRRLVHECISRHNLETENKFLLNELKGEERISF